MIAARGAGQGQEMIVSGCAARRECMDLPLELESIRIGSLGVCHMESHAELHLIPHM